MYDLTDKPIPDRPEALDTGMLEPGRAHVMVLWLITIFLVAGFAALPILRHLRRTSDPNTQSRISLNFRLTAQYHVGYHVLQQKIPIPSLKGRNLQIDAIEKHASTHADQLALVIIDGELAGREQALARLANFNAPPTFPGLQNDAKTLKILYTAGPDKLDRQQSKQLLENYRWFGRLALAFGKAADNPMRQASDRHAALVFGLLLSVLPVLLIIAVIGALLLVIAGIAIYSGKMALVYQQKDGLPQGSRLRFLEVFSLFLAMLMLTALMESLFKVGYGWLIHPALILIVFWLPIRGVPMAQARTGLGLHPGKGIIRELGFGMIGYLAGVPIVLAGILISAQVPRLIQATRLTPYLPDTANHPAMEQLAKGSSIEIIGLFIIACVLAPILEETFFRGALYHYLRRRHRFITAALISSLLFAAVHPQSIVGIPALAAIGFVMAMIREWRGSLLAPMLAHAIHNGMVLSLGLILTG